MATSALALPPELADAVAVADCETVLQAIKSPSADDERLAVGWCLRKHDPARSESVLAGVTAPALADYARWVRAESAHAAGKHESTLSILDGLSLQGTPGLRLRMLRARALLAVGRSLEARPDLRDLTGTEMADEARFLLSRGAEDRGDLGPAIATYRVVWASSTRGAWSQLAQEALARLGASVPNLQTEDGRLLVGVRIESLEKARMYSEALELILSLRTARGHTDASWALGRSQFRARRYPDAVATWSKILGAPEESAGSSGSLFDYALATSRTGDYATAAIIYRRVIEQHPGHAKGDEASYKLGYLAYDSGDCANAVALFDDHLQRYPKSRMLESTLWFQGRCRWLMDDRDGAVTTWSRLVREAPRSSLVPAVHYWTARAKGLAGDTAGERAGLSDLLESHPESGHAFFAATRLGTRFPSRAIVQRPAWPAELAARADVRRAEALLAGGFRSWARLELQSVIAPARSAGRDGALAAAHALHLAGDYKAGKKLARPFCTSATRGGDPVAQQACYPRPEATIVSRAARAYGLPELLPYGIMISESAMTPDVTSFAGARGLMQVMPAEGERLHEAAMGHGEFDPDDLYLAPYNALIGTTELGLKRRSLDGMLTPEVLPAVIASYNAGETAVRRWLGELGEGPVEFDVFAEAIGYTETRRYVRGVLGHYMTYRWVYGDPE